MAIFHDHMNSVFENKQIGVKYSPIFMIKEVLSSLAS
jgi:hypothetical protein